MASVTWPLTLPQSPLIRGFDEEQRDRTIRTSTDSGIDQVRTVLAAPAEPFKMTMQLTKDQKAILRSFHTNDLEGGALRFNFPDPTTQVPAEFSIVGNIKYVPSGIGWLAAMSMEKLP